VSGRSILLSGNIELNPGPSMNSITSTKEISFNNVEFVFRYRLARYALRPLDVGGGGD
jgi:hypothetical protein